MSVRWLVPLVVVVAVAFAPLSLEACQVACEAHHAAVTSAPAHECDHHAAATNAANRPGIVGLPHACGHSDNLPPTSSIGAPLTLHAPAVLPMLFELVAPAPARAVILVAPFARDDVPIASRVPLRV